MIVLFLLAVFEIQVGCKWVAKEHTLKKKSYTLGCYQEN